MYGLNRGDVRAPGPNHRERSLADVAESGDKFSSRFKARSAGEGAGYGQDIFHERDAGGSKRLWNDRAGFSRGAASSVAAGGKEAPFPRAFHGRVLSESDASKLGVKSYGFSILPSVGEKSTGYSQRSSEANGIRADPRNPSTKAVNGVSDSLLHRTGNGTSSTDKKKNLGADFRGYVDHPVSSGRERSSVLYSGSLGSREDVLKAGKAKAEGSKLLDVWESDSREGPPSSWRSGRSRSFSSALDAGVSDWVGDSQTQRATDANSLGDSLVTSPRQRSGFASPSQAVSPPAKKTRLGWGQGLAKYEGKVGDAREPSSQGGPSSSEPKAGTSGLSTRDGELKSVDSARGVENQNQDVQSSKEGSEKTSMVQACEPLQGKRKSDYDEREPVSETGGLEESSKQEEKKVNGVCLESVAVQPREEQLTCASDVGAPTDKATLQNVALPERMLEDLHVKISQEHEVSKDLLESGVLEASNSMGKAVEGTAENEPIASTGMASVEDSQPQSMEETPSGDFYSSHEGENDQASRAEVSDEGKKNKEEHNDILSLMEGVDNQIEALVSQAENLLALERSCSCRLEDDDSGRVEGGTDDVWKKLEELLGSISTETLKRLDKSEPEVLNGDKMHEGQENGIGKASSEEDDDYVELSTRISYGHSYDGVSTAPPFLSTTRDVVVKIILDNQRKAMDSRKVLHEELFSLTAEQIYASPLESPSWKLNEEIYASSFEKFRERVQQLMSLDVSINLLTALKFRAFRDVWKTEQAERKVSMGKSVVKCGPGRGRNGYHQQQMMSDLSGRSFVLSQEEHDMQVMKSLERLMQQRADPTARLRMPSMFLGSQNISSHCFLNNNSLVVNPREIEHERKMIRPWTVEEKETFYSKFAEYGKDFASISACLPYKTVGDCIEFYYRNQKSKDFRKPKKKQEVSRNASYMATTRQRAVRARQFNAVENIPSLRDVPKATRTPTNRPKDFGRVFPVLQKPLPVSSPVRISPRAKAGKLSETEEEMEEEKKAEPKEWRQIHPATADVRKENMGEQVVVKANGKATQEESDSEPNSDGDSGEKVPDEVDEKLRDNVYQPSSVKASLQQENGTISAVLALSAPENIANNESGSPKPPEKELLSVRSDSHVDFELPLILEDVVEGVVPQVENPPSERQDSFVTDRPVVKETDATKEVCDIGVIATEANVVIATKENGNIPHGMNGLKEEVEPGADKSLSVKNAGKVPGKLPRGRPPKDKNKGKKKKEDRPGKGRVNGGRRSISPFEEGDFNLPESFRVGNGVMSIESPSFAPMGSQRPAPGESPFSSQPLSADFFGKADLTVPKRTSMSTLEQQVQLMMQLQRGNSLLSSLQAKGSLQQSPYSSLSQPMPVPSFQNSPLHNVLLPPHPSYAQLASTLNWPQVFQEDSSKVAEAEKDKAPVKGEVKLFGQSLSAPKRTASPDVPNDASRDALHLSVADSVEKWIASNVGGVSVPFVEDGEVEVRDVAAGIMRRGNLEGSSFGPTAGQTWMERVSEKVQAQSRTGEQTALELLRAGTEANGGFSSSAWSHQVGAGGAVRAPDRGAGVDLFGRAVGEGRLESLHSWRLRNGQPAQSLDDPQATIMALALASIQRQRQQQQQQQQQQQGLHPGVSGQMSCNGSEQLRRDSKEGM